MCHQSVRILSVSWVTFLCLCFVIFILLSVCSGPIYCNKTCIVSYTSYLSQKYIFNCLSCRNLHQFFCQKIMILSYLL